jgi:hypothetical protein
MRDDMHRIIINRPRKVGASARKGRARKLDELPTKQGMLRGVRERGGDKSFRDHLKPLRRYLEKQVGRPWDKVFSQVMTGRRFDSTIHRHLVRHIEEFVAIKPRRRVITFGRKTSRPERREYLWAQPFYVDEGDGILKRTDKLPEEKDRRRKIKAQQRPTKDESKG